MSCFHGKIHSVLVCAQKIKGVVEAARRRRRSPKGEHSDMVVCNNHRGAVPGAMLVVVVSHRLPKKERKGKCVDELPGQTVGS